MQRWQKKLIQTLWGSMIKLWDLQNKERHGVDKESCHLTRREVLHSQLAKIYARKLEYPLWVQQLLQTSYKNPITESVTKIAYWLDAYTGTFAIT
jgi:uncharacterized membrane protein YgaE (UPF0421/DUF939 family)